MGEETCKDCDAVVTEETGWYCSICGKPVCDEHVRVLEQPDKTGNYPDYCRACAKEIHEEQVEPDPPYDHTGYDTLEEKHL